MPTTLCWQNPTKEIPTDQEVQAGSRELQGEGKTRRSGMETSKPKGGDALQADSSTPAAAAVPTTVGGDGRDGEFLKLRTSVKRAHSVMKGAVSLIPTKVARYDTSTNEGNSQSLSAFVDEMKTGFINYDDHLVDGVIPHEYLKLDERHTPLDIENFKDRLQSFTLKLWPTKTDKLSSFHCARHGWKIVAENLLVCVSCHRFLAIPGTTSVYLSYSAWSTNIEDMIKNSGHSPDCIWIKSPSPLNILKLPSGKDMEMYMIRVAGSYKRMETLPILTDHYHSVMTQIDLSGLKRKTALNLTQKLEGATQEMMEEVALFLMINGWTMESLVDNTLKCNSCEREVPLWLCLPTPPRSDFQSPLPPSSSYSKFMVRSSVKKFDPLLNHYFWCPWRAFLQSVEGKRNQNMEEIIFGDKSNFFAGAGMTSNIRKQADVVNYHNLGTQIDADFKAGRILMGPSNAMSNPDAAIHTMFNVKNILNSIAGDASTPETRSLLKHVKFSEFQRNEIISLKPSQSTSNIFLNTASMPSVNEIPTSELHSLEAADAELTTTPAENPHNSDCVLNPITTSDFQTEDNEGLDIVDGLGKTAGTPYKDSDESGISMVVEDQVSRTELNSYEGLDPALKPATENPQHSTDSLLDQMMTSNFQIEGTEALVEIEESGRTTGSQHENGENDDLYCFDEPDPELKRKSAKKLRNTGDALFNEIMSSNFVSDDDDEDKNYDNYGERDQKNESDAETDEIDSERDESDGEGDEIDGERDEIDGERDESDGEGDNIDGERDVTDPMRDESDGEGDESDDNRDESDGEVDEIDGEVEEIDGEVDEIDGASRARDEIDCERDEVSMNTLESQEEEEEGDFGKD